MIKLSNSLDHEMLFVQLKDQNRTKNSSLARQAQLTWFIFVQLKHQNRSKIAGARGASRDKRTRQDLVQLEAQNPIDMSGE